MEGRVAHTRSLVPRAIPRRVAREVVASLVRWTLARDRDRSRHVASRRSGGDASSARGRARGAMERARGTTVGTAGDGDEDERNDGGDAMGERERGRGEDLGGADGVRAGGGDDGVRDGFDSGAVDRAPGGRVAVGDVRPAGKES